MAPSSPVLALARFAAAMSRRDSRAAARSITRARALGATRAAAEEAALMLVLYAGFPAALEGLRTLNEAWPGRARRTSEGTPDVWRLRGERLCRDVYGPAFGRLLPAVEALHPDLAAWMIEHGYGRVLARRGLSPVDRELVTIASLAALGWERQLVSHLLGAARLGARRSTIRWAHAAGMARADRAARTASRRAWGQVFGDGERARAVRRLAGLRGR